MFDDRNLCSMETAKTDYFATLADKENTLYFPAAVVVRKKIERMFSVPFSIFFPFIVLRLLFLRKENITNWGEGFLVKFLLYSALSLFSRRSRVLQCSYL